MNENVIDAAAYAQRAFYFIERRRLPDARRVLKEALGHFPQDPDLLFHSAQVDWLADENDAAEKTARQVLALAPEHAATRHLLVGLLVERREFADAEQMLLGLLRDYPESAELYGTYSRVMLLTLHLDKAEKLAQEGLRYDPEDRECLLAFTLCEIARHGARANQGLEKLLTAHPESMSSVHALVIALLDSGRIEEAHRVAQGALRADPANEHLVAMVRELRLQNHWTMLPLYPMQRWGWGAAAAMWVGAIVVMRYLRANESPLYEPFVWTWLAYAIYSWVWPPLARKIL